MKHVLAPSQGVSRDGTQVPMKKNRQGRDPRTREENSQGWDPMTHERKSSAHSRLGCGLVFRPMGKDASENPMRAIKVEKLVLNAVLVKVVTDLFALRRRHSRLKAGFSHTESLGGQEGERRVSG